MFTEEFKKACEACQSEEELEAVIDSHKSELTDEDLQQVAGGFFTMRRIIVGSGINIPRGMVEHRCDETIIDSH